MSGAEVLTTFHPAVAAWFRERFSAPTEAQVRAWPVTAGGGHALIAAPTGSGKTLAAFLSAINGLVVEGLARGLTDEVHVLYISPLKALSVVGGVGGGAAREGGRAAGAPPRWPLGRGAGGEGGEGGGGVPGRNARGKILPPPPGGGGGRGGGGRGAHSPHPTARSAGGS